MQNFIADVVRALSGELESRGFVVTIVESIGIGHITVRPSASWHYSLVNILVFESYVQIYRSYPSPSGDAACSTRDPAFVRGHGFGFRIELANPDAVDSILELVHGSI